ncbi:MAG: AAA family ATPase [Clostridia bacterium]|nr:AAA family ATPase [Clostridia bacterium]
MDFINVQEAAEKWQSDERSITRLCRDGRIPGAVKDNGKWLIPANADRPKDGRRKKKSLAVFRKPLPIGVSDFKEAVSRYYYVDKTELIKDILDDLPKVSLFTRPRRFGKTLTMDMLRVFFEKSEEDTSRYFADKKIWTYGEKYTSYQGKYPVIYLSFKDVKFDTWEDTIAKMKSLFQAEFIRHKEIIGAGTKADQYEINYYNRMLLCTETEVELTEAFTRLSKMLHDFHGIAPVIIIDEYDTPIQQGYAKNYYEKIVLFMRNLFSGGFKDNSHLSFGFVTGILRVAKESIFSGMNNFVDNSVLNERYSTYFGFTKDEVKTILSAYGKRNKLGEACEWYDGYRFGSNEIFNPWSVISYINNECTPQAYWQNTGSNDIIRQIVLDAPVETKEKLQTLLEGKPVLADIDTSVIYPEIKDNPQTIFSFLLIAGYLKLNKSPNVAGTSFYYVSIPNKEIERIYGKEILSAIGDFRTQSTASSIQQAIIDNDIAGMRRHLEHYLKQTVSFFDTSNESFYHGLMLGLYAVMNDLYSVTSNREAGNGRFDIQMVPLSKNMPAIIIELKVLSSETANEKTITEQLQALSRDALRQIDEKEYALPLEERGLSIMKLGIAFYKKQAEAACKM